MAALNLSGSQLTFLGACVKDRIDRMDESIKTLRDLGSVVGVPMSDEEFQLILVLSVYRGIANQIEDALARSDLEYGLEPVASALIQ